MNRVLDTQTVMNRSIRMEEETVNDLEGAPNYFI
jgi:hypothetical protein